MLIFHYAYVVIYLKLLNKKTHEYLRFIYFDSAQQCTVSTFNSLLK